MSVTTHIHMRLAGRFKFEAVKILPDGTEQRRSLTGWCPNLITNAGLDRICSTGISDQIIAIGVGSGNKAPAVTDTALQSQIARTGTVKEDNAGLNTNGSRYGWRRKTMRFGVGEAAGNLSEVGVFSATSGGICFSRALIVDGSGTPTTITVLADEQLDVTYELRNYQPSADGYWSATISGVVYTGTVRMANSNRGDVYIQTWVPRGPSGYDVGMLLATGSYNSAYETNTLGATTTVPAGTPSVADTITSQAYVAGTYARTHTVSFSLNRGNFASGIGSFTFGSCVGEYQLSVSPKIVKTTSHVLNLTVVVSVGRYTP